MSTTHKVLKEDEFIEQFRPETYPDGSLYVQRDWGTEAEKRLLEEMHGKRRLWTMVDDGDGGMAIVQGYAYVNRLYYILCEVPYGDDVTYEVASEEED